MKEAKYHTRVSKLRIWDYYEHMPAPPLVEYQDFTIIGLISLPSVYGPGGVKLKHDYVNDKEELVVCKKFSYDYDGDAGVTIKFEWYDFDGNIGLEKSEFKPLNPIQVAKLKKANRDRTLMYLKAIALGTPIEPYVSSILGHYKYVIELWLLNGTTEWMEAIYTEPPFETDGVTPNSIYQYLDIQTSIPSEDYPEGLTVRDGILYQITADE